MYIFIICSETNENLKICSKQKFLRILFFSTDIYNMEGKLSTQTVAFFYVYLPIVRAESPVLAFLPWKFFYHEIIAHLP